MVNRVYFFGEPPLSGGGLGGGFTRAVSLQRRHHRDREAVVVFHSVKFAAEFKKVRFGQL